VVVVAVASSCCRWSHPRSDLEKGMNIRLGIAPLYNKTGLLDRAADEHEPEAKQ
jgi:hypothetical protein